MRVPGLHFGISFLFVLGGSLCVAEVKLFLFCVGLCGCASAFVVLVWLCWNEILQVHFVLPFELPVLLDFCL